MHCTNIPRESRVSVRALANTFGKHQAWANIGGTHNEISFMVDDSVLTESGNSSFA